MKKLITFFFFSFISFPFLFAQEHMIVGPTSLCPGECALYSVSGDGIDDGTPVNWFNGPFQVSENSIFELCWESPGTDFSLSSSVNGFSSTINIDMLDENTSSLTLNSDNFCSDEETDCEKVCQGQTVNYSISATGDTQWNIQGSEDYEFNGNSASVTWNEIGEGSVEVSGVPIPLSINCQPGIDGDIALFIEGGTYPIDVNVNLGSSSTNYTFDGPTGFNFFLLDYIPGVFGNIITVTDANGMEELCVYSPELTSLCVGNTAIPSEISSPTDCSSCNGTITFVAPNEMIEWEDGVIADSRSDLCPGDYTVTMIDESGTSCELPTITLTDNLCGEIPSSDFFNFNAGFVLSDVWWAQVEGGTEPYTLTIIDHTGISFDFPFSQIGSIFTNGTTPLSSGPGDYIFTIMDGTGQEITLIRTAPTSGSSIENPSTITSTTDCGMCNGVIEFNAVGGGNYIEVYDGPILLMAGVNLMIDNLCPGVYGMRIYEDASGAGSFTSISIIIGDNCPVSTTVTCLATTIQCVQVLPNPEAQFASLPAAADNVVEICNQQSINFQNESTGAESFIWDFGDFNTSVSANPVHTYANPGTYNVTCIARNDCFCSDTTSLTVNVLASDIPEIECVGTVCVGDTVTYASPAECSTFAWQISGEGELTDGGGLNDNYAQVVWGNGPVGTVALSVGGCGTNSICSQANVAQIPILSGDAVINGPAKVCNSTQVIYSIPKYDGTDFQWTISEFGTITSGENTHQITVLWEGATPNNAQFVEVIYENCWLECGGNAQMDVSIVPEFYTQGVPLICENESSIYYARETANDSPASVNWTVLNADGTIVYTAVSVVSVMIPFEFGNGEYTILTTPANINDYCTASYELKVQVSELPNAPVAINGQTQICLGETYNYTAQSDLTNPIMSWTINDAGNFTTQTGSTAVVTWQGTGVHLISATQTSANGLDCTSESITLNVETVGSVTMSGTPIICAESTANYTATELQGVSYSWSITPSNAGTIVSGDNTNSVEIYWAYGGNATVNLQLCGQNLSQNVEVKSLPIPQITHPDYLCPNQTATVSLTENYQSYLWKDEDGTTISEAPTVDLVSGYYEIEVTDTDGCTGNSIFNIGDFTTNNLNISTSGFRAICPAAGIGFPIIYAPELEVGFTYEWFLNGLSLGIDATEIQTSDYGTYTVEATNIDGCTTISNGITISDGCGSGGPPPPPSGGCELDFSFQNVGDCRTFDFMPTSGNVISVVEWNFGDGETSTDFNAQHTYDEVGLYHIILIATVIGSDGSPVACFADLPLTFPVTADFAFDANCAGEALQFNDISLTVGTGDIVSHAWDFDDLASGNNTSSDANPSHIFSSAGTYSVSLTVTDATGCSDEKIKEIEVFAAPTVSFIAPDQTCAATALPFAADVSGNVVSYNWNFGDPASGDANTAKSQNVWHNYENAGSYDVTLTGSDIYGCEDADTQTVVTEPNNLTGDIAVFPSNTICEGNNVTLDAPEGGTIWQWSTGETSESITVVAAGNYKVTLTSANGCSYIPAGQIIEILPVPSGDIYAVELDEFGNPINYVFETHEVCYGEDVFLQIEENELYSYEWSTGSTTTDEEFSEDRDNILEVGTTDISVTIIDLLTGCSSISTYSVIVHPQPENILISSDTPSPICGNSSAILSVENPDVDLDYIWNTGDLGPQITLIAGGEYWIRAINEFGCEGESNHIIVENAPDIDKVPDGCHTLCDVDTLCLPTLENVAVYQWYFNGEILTTETASTPDLIMSEDGEYQLFMEDINGCTSWSDPLNVEFYEGQGAVYGQVWLDTNENGVIDDEDENVTGINIQITDENGLNLSNVSVDEGYYVFQDIPTTDYFLTLDTLSIPSDLTYTIIENTTVLQGCSDEVGVDWLLLPVCASVFGTLDIPSCDGISAFYDDIEILVGESQEFAFTANNGCDSTLTVTAYVLPPDTTAELLQICQDETIEINGEFFEVGDETDVILTNQLGCDSIVTYSIISADSSPSSTEIAICADEIIEINGQMLEVGDVTGILFTNQAGCDSIVTYTVLSAASMPTNQTIQLCEGESIEIEGTTVNAGETVTIELTNQAGCDSTINVTADALSPDFTSESIQVCEGEIFEYQNIELQAGETQTFTLINQSGCDSLVELTVSAFATATFSSESSMACLDINDGSFIIGNLIGGTPPFEYSLNGNDWQTNPEFTELYGGNYLVQIRDANNCFYEENIDISIAAELELVAEDQIFPCGAEELELEVSTSGGVGNPNFIWNTGDSTSTILIEDIGTYSLTVFDECYEQTAEIEVVRGFRNNTSIFYIPNAFSPNSDNANDTFCPLSAADVEVLTYHLMIFDRWGNFVFESFTPENCWDGTFKNKMMNTGVFVYALEAEVLVCEALKQVLESGDVMIVR